MDGAQLPSKALENYQTEALQFGSWQSQHERRRAVNDSKLNTKAPKCVMVGTGLSLVTLRSESLPLLALNKTCCILMFYIGRVFCIH